MSCNASFDLVVHVKNRGVATFAQLAEMGEFLASLIIRVILAELVMQLLNVPESGDGRLRVTMADVEFDKADRIELGCCRRHQVAQLRQPAESMGLKLSTHDFRKRSIIRIVSWLSSS